MDENQHTDEPDTGLGEDITIHHSVHHPRRVDVRIDGARRSPLDTSVDGGKRLVMNVLSAAGLLVLIVLIAFVVTFYVQAKAAYRYCSESNFRAENTAMALGDLAAAAEASGDPKEAVVLRKFKEDAFKEPLPECSKPPFTREYQAGDR